MKAQIIIDVEYELGTTTAREIRELLTDSINDLYRLGKLSGSLDATVDNWRYNLKLTNKPT